MKRISILLAAALLAGQESSTKKFTGTWEARFNGAVFCVLKVQPGENPAGSMTAFDIGVDNEGNLTNAQGPNETIPILKPALTNDAFTFEWTDNPNEDPLQFELTLTGKQEAQLRFVTAPEGVKIKPFHFKKSG